MLGKKVNKKRANSTHVESFKSCTEVEIVRFYVKKKGLFVRYGNGKCSSTCVKVQMYIFQVC